MVELISNYSQSHIHSLPLVYFKTFNNEGRSLKTFAADYPASI